MKTVWKKNPTDVLDFEADWGTKWMTAGDTISASTWTLPDGITKTKDEFTDTTATVWISGGTDQQIYEVSNQIVTDQGRTASRTFELRVAVIEA